MVENCYVVGAGFSCCYSPLAPTMQNFLQEASARGIYHPAGQHRELGATIARYYGEGAAPNIENLATFLNTRTPDHPFKEGDRRQTAYDQLIDVVRFTLGEVHTNSRTANTEALFQSFAQKVCSDSSPVISFNYDLLIDDLLRRTKQWAPINGYGVSFPIAGTRWTTESAPHPRLPNVTRTTVFKLHGSLNWVVRRVEHEDGTQPIELGSMGYQHLSQDRAHPHIVAFVNDLTAGGGSAAASFVNYFYKAFIVPPLAQKASYFDQPAVRNIWYGARAALSAASRIYVLGYSFPEGDFDAETLFREGLAWPVPNRDREMIIVNLDEKVFEKARARFSGIENLRVLRASQGDVADFLKAHCAQ